MQRISETKEKSRVFEEKVKRKKQIGGKKRVSSALRKN